MSAISIDIIFGFCKIVPTYARTERGMKLGGYSIRYDRDGKEVSRTQNSWSCEVIGPIPFIPAGYERMESGND